MDLATSFPLSRFAQNEEKVVLKFAVGGADALTEVNDRIVALYFVTDFLCFYVFFMIAIAVSSRFKHTTFDSDSCAFSWRLN